MGHNPSLHKRLTNNTEKQTFVIAFCQTLALFADMAHLEKRITLRLPENWMPEIRQAMARKGTINMGDFVRQAVCAEISRTTARRMPSAVNFATAEAQPQEARS